MPDWVCPPEAVAATVKLRLRPGAEDLFNTWQARFTNVLTGFPGFLSVDLLPLYAGSSEWSIVQQFRSAEQMKRWSSSDERRQLLDEARAFREDAPENEPVPEFHASSSSVTEVIVTAVKPGQEPAFRDWCESIQSAQGGFPGYMGTYVQSPASAAQAFWTTLVRFSTPEQLNTWLTSHLRRDLVRKSEMLVDTWESHRLPSSFAGWFPQNAVPRNQSAAWKQTAIVLLVLFPVVMLELRYLTPQLGHVNAAVGTFVGNAISVSLVSWPLAPIAIRGLGWWLQPAPANRTRVTIIGALTMAILYAAEIIFFWQLFRDSK